MTSFANDPATTHSIVLRPVIGRNGTGIHSHDEGLRVLDRLQQRLHLLYLRRKTAIEANNQLRAAARLPGIFVAGCMGYGVGSFDIRQLGMVNGQRLLDKHVLSCLDRFNHKAGMRVMSGNDDHGIYGRIAQHRCYLRGSLGKAGLLAMDHSIDTSRSNDGVKLRPCRLKRWNQHPRGIVTRAYKTHHGTLSAEAQALCQRHATHNALTGRRRVLQQDAETTLILGERLICLGGIFESKSMSDQGLNVQLTTSKHV
ncbi:hypothetical protein D9M72_379520 [compost metagenome]